MIIKEINQEDIWKIRQIVMWPNKPIDFVQLPDDYKGIHYGLFNDNELTSVVSCFVNNGDMQFRKLATLAHKQGKGYGTSLLNYIINIAKENEVKRVWCNARVNKKAFYEKFGFAETGKRFEKDGIDFTIMELMLNK
jgi:predicted GNAT family N-acyltransferase